MTQTVQTLVFSFQHAPYDAMVMVNIAHYVDERVLETEGRWKVCQSKSSSFLLGSPPPIDIFNVFSFQGSEKVRDIPLPEELVFTVDEKILNDVSQAKAQHLKAVWF